MPASAGMTLTKVFLAALCSVVLLAGCAAEPKRPAGKSRPVATASKSKTAAKAAPAKKPTAKPVPRKVEAPQQQAKAAPPKAVPPKAVPPKAAPAKPPVAPRTPQELYAEALEFVKANRWAEAEAALTAYIKQAPQYTGPHTNLGIVYARTNRKPQAAAAFAKAVTANPNNAAAHVWLGVLAREAGDFQQAEANYRKALAADLNYPTAHLNLAILYDQYLRQPAEALKAYQRYRELAGKDDLRAAVWVAELESKLKQPATATP